MYKWDAALDESKFAVSFFLIAFHFVTFACVLAISLLVQRFMLLLCWAYKQGGSKAKQKDTVENVLKELKEWSNTMKKTHKSNDVDGGYRDEFGIRWDVVH